MSFLSDLNPIGKIGGAIAEMVEHTADKFLPEPIGDIASGVVNYFTGNYEGVVADAVDLSENIVTGLKGFADGFFKSEPEPPPGHGGFDGGDMIHREIDRALDRLGPALEKIKGSDIKEHGLVGAAKEAIKGAVSGEVEMQGKAQELNSGSDAAKTEGADKAGGKPIIEDAKAFLKMATDNPDEFFKRILSGEIPDSVKNDPSMLQSLQANVNNIMRAVQMLTNLMQSVHDIQMAVIRNVRA